MKKITLFLVFVFCFSFFTFAQCSICTKTAEQLGEGPAKGLNSGILYLMFTPLAIIAVVGYRWWRNERSVD